MKLLGNLESYTDLELALLVMLGQFGNGSARRSALGSRYSAVQGIVNQMITGYVPKGKGSIDSAKLKTVIKELRPTESDMNEIADEICNKFF